MHDLGEIGDVILGWVSGRSGDKKITIFRALGIAAQELCLADLLIMEAEEQGVGRIVAI